jgi:hypothetical protein
MRTLFLLACLLSAATAAEKCGEAITSTNLVCNTVSGQTVSFDPRFVLAQSRKKLLFKKTCLKHPPIRTMFYRPMYKK